MNVAVLIEGELDVGDEGFVDVEFDGFSLVQDGEGTERCKELGGGVGAGLVLDDDDIGDALHQCFLIEGGTKDGGGLGTAIKHFFNSNF